MNVIVYKREKTIRTKQVPPLPHLVLLADFVLALFDGKLAFAHENNLNDAKVGATEIGREEDACLVTGETPLHIRRNHGDYAARNLETLDHFAHKINLDSTQLIGGDGDFIN